MTRSIVTIFNNQHLGIDVVAAHSNEPILSAYVSAPIANRK